MTDKLLNVSVAISYVVNHDFPEEFRERFDAPRNRVAESLRARGISVVFVNAAMPEQVAPALLHDVDGVVIMGGIDVDPSMYGEEITVDTIQLTNRSADQYEVDLVRGAQNDNTPVFGICRGSQVINVALGGSLVQDIGLGIHMGSTVGEGKTADDRWLNHEVTIEPGTRLAGLFGHEPMSVRTSHHQSVARLGEGLTIAAFADDGTVEAVESADGWIVGVQWHPEQVKAEADELDILIDAFVTAVTAHVYAAV